MRKAALKKPLSPRLSFDTNEQWQNESQFMFCERVPHEMLCNKKKLSQYWKGNHKKAKLACPLDFAICEVLIKFAIKPTWWEPDILNKCFFCPKKKRSIRQERNKLCLCLQGKVREDPLGLTPLVNTLLGPFMCFCCWRFQFLFACSWLCISNRLLKLLEEFWTSSWTHVGKWCKFFFFGIRLMASIFEKILKATSELWVAQEFLKLLETGLEEVNETVCNGNSCEQHIKYKSWWWREGMRRMVDVGTKCGLGAARRWQVGEEAEWDGGTMDIHG